MNFSRRDVLASGLAVSSLGLAGCGQKAQVTPKATHLEKIGVQLYTLRDLFTPDAAGTLKAVRKIGYDFVEYGGGDYEKMDHVELRAVMDGEGLECSSAHTAIEWLDEDFPAMIKMGQTLGADYLVVPWLGEQYRNADSYKALGEKFSKLGETLSTEGLKFAYHNHEFEFDEMEPGKTGFDLMMENSDPAFVFVEMDFFWATKAGADISGFFKRFPGRSKLSHVKDMNAAGEMVNVGEGNINFAELIGMQDLSGITHYIVEHDQPKEPHLEAVTISHEHLRKLAIN